MRKLVKRVYYALYIDALSEGPIPVEKNQHGHAIIYDCRLAAQRALAEAHMDRIEEFLAGARDFEDAMYVEEWIETIRELEDGTLIDTFDQPIIGELWCH